MTTLNIEKFSRYIEPPARRVDSVPLDRRNAQFSDGSHTQILLNGDLRSEERWSR